MQRRKAFTAATTRFPRPPLIGRFLPAPETVPAPFVVPSAGGRPPFTPVLLAPADVLEAAAPRLSRGEEMYALALAGTLRPSPFYLPYPHPVIPYTYFSCCSTLSFSIIDAAAQALGPDAATVVKGDAFVDPSAALRFLLSAVAAAPAPAAGSSSGGSGGGSGGLSASGLTGAAQQLLKRLQPPAAATAAMVPAAGASSNTVKVRPVSLPAPSPAAPRSLGTPLILRPSPSFHPSRLSFTSLSQQGLADGLSGMTPEESEALRQTAAAVTDRLRDRLVERLQPLKTRGLSLGTLGGALAARR